MVGKKNDISFVRKGLLLVLLDVYGWVFLAPDRSSINGSMAVVAGDQDLGKPRVGSGSGSRETQGRECVCVFL